MQSMVLQLFLGSNFRAGTSFLAFTAKIPLNCTIFIKVHLTQFLLQGNAAIGQVLILC